MFANKFLKNLGPASNMMSVLSLGCTKRVLSIKIFGPFHSRHPEEFCKFVYLLFMWGLIVNHFSVSNSNEEPKQMQKLRV